jgi:hypothetical protein
MIFFLISLPVTTDAIQKAIPIIVLSGDVVNIPTTVKTSPMAARTTVIIDAFFGVNRTNSYILSGASIPSRCNALLIVSLKE